MKNQKTVREQIGEAYINGFFESENGNFVELAYREIARVNEQLFEQIPFKVIFTESDLYESAREMREHVQSTGVIHIYKGGSDHEFFTEEQNWKGRAVHDVFAHLVCGCPFSFVGEYNAYLEQRKHYPEWTWRVLFAEIPAQTAGYYVAGGFNFKQRAIQAPQQWLNDCEQFMTDYSENSILDKKYFIQNKCIAL